MGEKNDYKPKQKKGKEKEKGEKGKKGKEKKEKGGKGRRKKNIIPREKKPMFPPLIIQCFPSLKTLISYCVSLQKKKPLKQ